MVPTLAQPRRNRKVPSDVSVFPLVTGRSVRSDGVAGDGLGGFGLKAARARCASGRCAAGAVSGRTVLSDAGRCRVRVGDSGIVVPVLAGRTHTGVGLGTHRCAGFDAAGFDPGCGSGVERGCCSRWWEQIGSA